MIVYRITTPHFVAGVIAKDGTIRSAAYTVKYMKGWTIRKMIDYAQAKGWQTAQILEGVGDE